MKSGGHRPFIYMAFSTESQVKENLNKKRHDKKGMVECLSTRKYYKRAPELLKIRM